MTNKEKIDKIIDLLINLLESPLSYKIGCEHEYDSKGCI